MLERSVAVPRLMRIIPAPVQARAISMAVSHALKGQALAARLGELSGKRFRLCIDDVPVALTFEIVAGGLRRSKGDPDVTMRGSLRDFAALALRREDPDTLFFQRRLTVEGETETGLHLKNLLDGWEYDVPAHFDAVLPAPVAKLGRVATRGLHLLRELSQLRRSGSRRSSRRAVRAAASSTAR